MVSETSKEPTELNTFLPENGSNGKDGSKAKYAITDTSRDVETAINNDKSFDPFKERKVANPTTDNDTLTHLLKASLGTGILAMPVAFRSAGLVMGVFLMILVSFICTHCSYILVKCAHVLYHKKQRTEMSFAEVAESSFSVGPNWAKPFAKPSKYLIEISLFATYYGACSVYAMIIAENFRQILNHYLESDVSTRCILLALLVPLVLISWVPDLKYLAPVSTIANIFMGTGLGITVYYLVKDLQLSDMENISLVEPISGYPTFLSISIFAIEAIGVVMPLENSMKTPQHFVGIFGVLNKGMSGVTLVYIFVGFLGYLRFGPDTADSITLNLPINEIPAQLVKILIGLAVYCTFTLQFFVCLGIVWSSIKGRFQKSSTIANYVLRTFLVTGAVLIAVAVPTIGPFIELIGALCLSIAGLLLPVFIETVTYWDIGFGRFNWVAVKNVFICIFGIMALIFGTKSSLASIYQVLNSTKQ